MAAPIYSASDYQRAFQALLPRGRVWPRDADSTQGKTIKGLVQVCYRTNLRAVQLLADAFPATTYELLPDWEQTLGLPDPCTGGLGTIQQRRAAVLGTLTGNGGQSAAYFQQLAAALGFSINVTNYAPFRMGQSRMGQQLGGPEWFFYWTVGVPQNTTTYFRMGQSVMGEPLQTWSTQLLACRLAKLKPAHTTLKITYF